MYPTAVWKSPNLCTSIWNKLQFIIVNSPSNRKATLLMEDSPPMPLSQVLVLPPRRQDGLSSCNRQQPIVCYSKEIHPFKNDLETTNSRTEEKYLPLWKHNFCYLFEKGVSPDFLCSDLARIKLSHILVHHRLHIHGGIETTLQFPEQRHQGPRQKTCLLSATCTSKAYDAIKTDSNLDPF